MPPIIFGAPNFAKAQLPRFEADEFGHILTRWGARRLEITGNRRRIDQRRIDFIVPFAVVERFLAVHRPHPLTVSSLLDVLGFLRIHTTVKAQVRVPQGNAWDGGKILGNGNLHVRITVFPTWTCHNVAYRLSHYCSSHSITVLYVP